MTTYHGDAVKRLWCTVKVITPALVEIRYHLVPVYLAARAFRESYEQSTRSFHCIAARGIGIAIIGKSR